MSQPQALCPLGHPGCPLMVDFAVFKEQVASISRSIANIESHIITLDKEMRNERHATESRLDAVEQRLAKINAVNKYEQRQEELRYRLVPIVLMTIGIIGAIIAGSWGGLQIIWQVLGGG